jgi:stage III sporulation protein AA
MREWVRCIEPGAEEIRLRVGQPVEIIYQDAAINLERVVTSHDMEAMLNYICSYSPYAFTEQMRQGFITIEGGHRIGLCGAVATENGQIIGFSHVTFMNIRLASERRGCAAEIAGIISRDGEVKNTLIFSAPGVGKTTMLRDCVRVLSDKYKVCIVDERSEIAACHLGVPQNDVGVHTDVLDGAPKIAGINLLVRSMSPQIIAVDELGGEADMKAVNEAISAGCKVIATIHAGSIEDVRYLSTVFECYVELTRSKDGRRLVNIYEGEKSCLK